MRLSAFLPGAACKGSTQKGRPCAAKDIFENGYCKHHGGEGKLPRVEWQKAKALRKVERALKRSKRLDRMIARAKKESPSLASMLEILKNGRQT